MTRPFVILQDIDSRESLAWAWRFCAAIARRFPDDEHWTQVAEAFRHRADELGLDWKGTK